MWNLQHVIDVSELKLAAVAVNPTGEWIAAAGRVRAAEDGETRVRLYRSHSLYPSTSGELWPQMVSPAGRRFSCSIFTEISTAEKISEHPGRFLLELLGVLCPGSSGHSSSAFALVSSGRTVCSLGLRRDRTDLFGNVGQLDGCWSWFSHQHLRGGSLAQLGPRGE